MRKSTTKGTADQLVNALEDQIAKLEGSDAYVESSALEDDEFEYVTGEEHEEYEGVSEPVTSSNSINDIISGNDITVLDSTIEDLYEETIEYDDPESVDDIINSVVYELVECDTYWSSWPKSLAVAVQDSSDAIIDYISQKVNSLSSANSSTITAASDDEDIDPYEYAEKLASETEGVLQSRGYEVTAMIEDDYIEFQDDNDYNNVFIQSIDDIEPNWDDLNSDASSLADAVENELGLG